MSLCKFCLNTSQYVEFYELLKNITYILLWIRSSYVIFKRSVERCVDKLVGTCVMAWGEALTDSNGGGMDTWPHFIVQFMIALSSSFLLSYGSHHLSRNGKCGLDENYMYLASHPIINRCQFHIVVKSQQAIAVTITWRWKVCVFYLSEEWLASLVLPSAAVVRLHVELCKITTHDNDNDHHQHKSIQGPLHYCLKLHQWICATFGVQNFQSLNFLLGVASLLLLSPEIQYVNIPLSLVPSITCLAPPQFCF